MSTSVAPTPRCLRREIACAIIVLCMGAWALLLPSTGEAAVATTYQGWGQVGSATGGAVPGWSWDATTQAWSARSLTSGTPAYLWPWTSDWEWAWTLSTGWLAVQQAYVTADAAPRLLWSDEFNAASGAAPGGGWAIQSGAYGYGAEACFTGSNVQHNGAGQLVIATRREPSCGGRAYSSASLDGTRQFGPPAAGQTITYEARAKGACGSGLWPAFWAVGAEKAWPLDGEVDMVELFGKNPTAASQTIHGPRTGTSDHWQLPFDTKAATSWCSAYHVYGARWSRGKIAFTIDGAVTRTLVPGSLGTGWSWPFDSYRQNLRLTVAAGGYGGAINNAALPSAWLVDYVRVFG